MIAVAPTRGRKAQPFEPAALIASDLFIDSLSQYKSHFTKTAFAKAANVQFASYYGKRPLPDEAIAIIKGMIASISAPANNVVELFAPEIVSDAVPVGEVEAVDVAADPAPEVAADNIVDDELTDEEYDAQQRERVKIALSICESDISSTSLKPWVFDTPHCLASRLKQVKVGKKNGAYFVRYGNGTIRNDKSAPDEADVLILDGDSRITADGEIVPGAPDPYLVHCSLQKHGFSNIIYSSFSNGENGDGYFKYRVLIFIKYNRQQLHTLLNYFHELLHDDGVMLLDVKENRAWSQPWFLPRVPAEREHLFTFYEYLDGYKPYQSTTDAICSAYEAAYPQIKPEPIHRPNPVIKPTYGLEIRVIDAFNERWRSPVFYLNAEEGYRCFGSRLLPPHCSDDSIAGVQVCQQCVDGVERVYSHHSNDPLCDGKPHDSFDCYKILRHGGDEKAALIAIGQSFMVNEMTLEAWNRLQHAKAKAPVGISWDSLAVVR